MAEAPYMKWLPEAALKTDRQNAALAEVKA